MTGTSPKPTIVIVHGAWTDASSFTEVQQTLTRHGYDVLEFANPLRSLSGDTDYLASFLRTRTTGPVIIVGHSYGGALIGAAAAHEARVRALVYVNAFVPAEGESLLDLLNSAGPVDPSQLFDMVPYPDAPEGDLDLYIQRGPFEPAFATGLSEEKQTEFYARQRPITLRAVAAPASAEQAWRTVPSWYVAGTRDGSIPLALQLRMAERAGSAVTQLESGHLSMVTHPSEVTEVIITAATSGDRS
ncbi:alpha/beta fold hydrolase [Brachybacterium sp. GCM10030268]|uniref:alpha/beta fold hydrolase n=1 Tax=Brachybacterium sp. GCM10030268 TaxID=3273382 RepID=UPI003615B439